MVFSLKTGISPELSDCVQKKVLMLKDNSKNEELGKKLFIFQELELIPFKAIPFPRWDKWEANPFNNRSWQWRLNWLAFLPYLIAYHHSSQNDEVLDSALEAIQSWLSNYLDTDGCNTFEFIWHDHATALRAEQLVLFIYYCRDYASEWANSKSDFFIYLEHALIIHGQWLAQDSFYSEHTNHGLEQARVLLLLGTVFNGKQASEWQKVALNRISSELKFSFTDEGVHVENSPSYHIFVFKVFLAILKDYPEAVLGNLAEEFNKLSTKALNFITCILRPDGKLPPIGDTEQLPTTNSYYQEFGTLLDGGLKFQAQRY